MVENQITANPIPQARPKGVNRRKSKFAKGIEQEKQQAQQKELPQATPK
jgi:hypothetical protein